MTCIRRFPLPIAPDSLLSLLLPAARQLDTCADAVSASQLNLVDEIDKLNAGVWGSVSSMCESKGVYGVARSTYRYTSKYMCA